MIINPLTSIDFYKADHRRQYPEGTSEVYSNFTARSFSHFDGSSLWDGKIVFFGLRYFISDFLDHCWNEGFFNQDKELVLKNYKKRMDAALGKDAISVDHLAALHDLGYLPLHIKALPEGARVKAGVPLLTIVNTHPDFFWLTNYIESALSCYLWKPITSATIAFEYKKLLLKYANKTNSSLEFVQYQAHDFSFRGMSNLQDAAVSGAAHLTSLYGTDTVQAIDFVEQFYGMDSRESIIGCSVPATEHSVMSMTGEEGELYAIRRLICELYPKGIVSIVSDTYNFWRVIEEYLPLLKNEILAREGRVVIRPDSGDPVDIICGYDGAKGVIEVLWDIFGGSITERGYKLLDPHIGVIYGDSITIRVAEEILISLEAQGFASGNIVFGIGSYTYQHVTRDTFGFAMKATSGVVNGGRRDIFKNPKTDSGVKKSARGLLRVEFENGEYVLNENQTEEQEKQGALKTIFIDGVKKSNTFNFDSIRFNLNCQLQDDKTLWRTDAT